MLMDEDRATRAASFSGSEDSDAVEIARGARIFRLGLAFAAGIVCSSARRTRDSSGAAGRQLAGIGIGDVEERFSRIYSKGVWNKNQRHVPKSGPGSSLQATKEVRTVISNVIQELGVRSMADVSCGDMTWMPSVELHGAKYFGYDIVDSVIRSNRQRFKTERPDFTFSRLNAIRQMIPQSVDLIFCRQALQHLRPNETIQALKNFVNSGSKYLLTTTYPWAKRNSERPYQHGLDYFIPLNLNDHPFNLPPPKAFFSDMVQTAGGRSVFDDRHFNPSMYVALWELPKLRKALGLPTTAAIPSNA